MAIPPAPQIEGCLKETINSIGFGIVGAVFIVNFGIAWIPNFFPWVMAILVVLQLILFLPERAKSDYEKFVESGRKGRHVIYSETGQMVLEDSREEGQGAHHKTRTGRIRDKFRKRGAKGSSGDIFLEVPKDGRVRRRSSTGSVHNLGNNEETKKAEVPTLSIEDKSESKEKDMEKKNEKEKETENEMKVEQEQEKGEKDKEEDKEKSGWRKRLHIGKSLSRRESLGKADASNRDKTI